MKKRIIKKMNTKKNALEHALYSDPDLDTIDEIYAQEVIQRTNLIHGYANTSAYIDRQLKILRKDFQHLHQPYALVYYAHVNIFRPHVNIFRPQANIDYSGILPF